MFRCSFILEGGFISRSKFNVDGDIEKRSHDGITFDSVLEMKFYRDVLCPAVESGDVISYELQKPYELQPKFEHDGKNVRAITYVADFYIVDSSGHEYVIDTKGCPDNTALLKRKLFWYHYPTVDYRWVTYVKKFGGWINYDKCKQLRKDEKIKKKELQEVVVNE